MSSIEIRVVANDLQNSPLLLSLSPPYLPLSISFIMSSITLLIVHNKESTLGPRTDPRTRVPFVSGMLNNAHP